MNPLTTIHDAETGQTITREMTDEETDFFKESAATRTEEIVE